MKADRFDHMLPAMRCDHGCGECCLVTPCNGSEFDRIAAYAAAHGVTPKAQGLTCPWFQNGGCAVYPARPLVCRMFGHVKKMLCPRGYNVNIQPSAELAMLRAYKADAGASGVRMLHEVVMGPKELADLVGAALRGPGSAELTVGGRSIPVPDNAAYQCARAMKSAGFGFKNVAFVDIGGAGIQ